MGAELSRQRSSLSGRLAFTDDPDPYALQGVFAMLMALDFTVHALAGDALDSSSLAVSALILTLAISGSAALVPWHRLPSWAVATLPVLDMAAISLSRVDAAGSATGVLVVVPGFWLGRLLGRQGAVVALTAGMAVITIPSLFSLGLSGANVSRSIMLVLVCAWVAYAIGANLEQVRREQDETQRHSDERDRALEVVDHQRRISEAILDSVDVGLVLLDREGTYQAMNRRHEDFMRLAFPEGHAGRAGQLGLVYGEDGEHALTREEMPTFRAMHGEEFDDCRIWVGDDPLTRRALSVSARSVRDEKGEFAGAALAYNDVTDFMRALKVKDEFIASVSHELRTPLTSIRGYVDLLLDRDDLPDEVVAQLAVVVRNTDRLGRLVADLLHTAQIDLGPLEVVRSRGDLAVIVGDAVDSAIPTAHSSGITLSYQGPRRLPMRLDQDRMRQVVDNLISNALKYTPPGGRVEVRLMVDGTRVELEVADSGIGIEAADRDRLFTRFFRTRHAEEQSIQGVGLGLSITKSIVESHGGRIEVESEVGRGSTFRVRVPVEG